MATPNWQLRRAARRAAFGLIVGAACVPFAIGASAATERARQSSDDAFVRLVRVLEAERTGVASPAGLGFSRAGAAFHVVGALAKDASAPDDTPVIRLVPFALKPDSDRAGSARLPTSIQRRINIAFDDRRARLLLLAGNGGDVAEVGARADGSLNVATLTQESIKSLGLQDPQGMSADPASGDVFFLDAGQPRILRVRPTSGGSFVGAGVSEIDLRPSGLTAVRGLAFDPATGHFHIGSGQKLYELSGSGQVLAVRDLSGFGLVDPQAMVFAPSGDETDDPAQLSIYVADRGKNKKKPGKIAELSLVRIPAHGPVTFASSLVRTVNTAAYAPPSPDPSGLTYLAGSNTLLMTDGEVEETVNEITHFAGANVWETTLSGSVVRTANISKVAPTATPMTNEPTGVTWQSSSGHYFFTDDGKKRVFNLNPGADQQIGTSDDSWTFFWTNVFGNGDPEGISYDSVSDHLFVADGVNAEIYEYTTAGVLVGHFDVLNYGVADPETVEVNPVGGTLFTLSNRQSGPIIVETTTSGALLETIDVSAAGARKPAGLAYAPASDGSGAKRFYFVDRGVDNNSDPNENDGKMYELTAPLPAATTS